MEAPGHIQDFEEAQEMRCDARGRPGLIRAADVDGAGPGAGENGIEDYQAGGAEQVVEEIESRGGRAQDLDLARKAAFYLARGQNAECVVGQDFVAQTEDTNSRATILCGRFHGSHRSSLDGWSEIFNGDAGDTGDRIDRALDLLNLFEEAPADQNRSPAGLYVNLEI